MTSYSEEVLQVATNNRVILIAKDDTVWVGFLIRDWNKWWRILGVDYSNSMAFRRGDIKKIIYLATGYVLPKNLKTNHKRIKELDLIELSELLNKAGCQFL